MKFIAFTQRLAIAFSLALIATTALAAPAIYQLSVGGLSCPFCVYGIEKKLNAIEGVERLETNLKEGTVMVTMKDNTKLDKATAEQAVKDAGFTLNGFRQAAPGDGQ